MRDARNVASGPGAPRTRCRAADAIALRIGLGRAALGFSQIRMTPRSEFTPSQFCHVDVPETRGPRLRAPTSHAPGGTWSIIMIL